MSGNQKESQKVSLTTDHHQLYWWASSSLQPWPIHDPQWSRHLPRPVRRFANHGDRNVWQLVNSGGWKCIVNDGQSVSLFFFSGRSSPVSRQVPDQDQFDWCLHAHDSCSHAGPKLCGGDRFSKHRPFVAWSAGAGGRGQGWGQNSDLTLVKSSNFIDFKQDSSDSRLKTFDFDLLILPLGLGLGPVHFSLAPWPSGSAMLLS